jgi:fumarylacetoacetase
MARSGTFPLVETPFGAVAPQYGVCSIGDRPPRVAVRLGDHALDLAALAEATGYELAAEFAQPTLNAFMARGPRAWSQTHEWVCTCLGQDAMAHRLVRLTDVSPRLPIAVADYVDFYASEHHAGNVGRMFRPDSDPLPPNWKHLPLGYHGRSGTVVVSGTPIIRPCGQRRPAGEATPVFGPTRRLDFEAEVGFVVGVPAGTPVPVAAAEEHIFGVCLVNDWSARDIQTWEYRPLGPFLGKSFATSMSAWILPLSALDAARVPPPPRDHTLLDYLADNPDRPAGLDLTLEVGLNATVLARPPFASMYYTFAQQLAHLTSNGATLRTGDLFASGTVSGAAPRQRGCLLELTWNGTQPVTLDDGRTRTFLEDGDEVVITATAPGPEDHHIAVGEVAGSVAAAVC